MYIAESDISRSHVGPHFLATHFANSADMTPKSAIFREFAIIPWTPFAGDSFREICSPRMPLIRLAGDNFPRNLLWANLAYLWNAGGNTCCAMASHGRRIIDTSIVSQSRLLLVGCPCKSVPQTANQGKTNAFLIKSLLTLRVDIRHFVKTDRSAANPVLARDWWTFLWWPCTPKYVLYHDAKRFKYMYVHQTAK